MGERPIMSRVMSKIANYLLVGSAWTPQTCKVNANFPLGIGIVFPSSLYLSFISPSSVACTFSCTLKFTVKDCDPNTGETEEDGYEDEYVVSWTESPLVVIGLNVIEHLYLPV